MVHYSVVIGMLCSTFGFICGMEHTMEYLLKKGFLSSVAINDYIVPVSTFSQALKKEAALTRTCLMHMKHMWSDKIFQQSMECRLMMHRKESYLTILDDTRQGNETYEYLKNFHSKNIRISYYGNKVCIIIQPMLYLISSQYFTGKKVKSINFTVDHLSDVLQKEWDRVCNQKPVQVIELESRGNMSSWIKVERVTRDH